MNNTKNTSFQLRDWLLIIGSSIAPMNYFRIWKIGPGELLCFIWCIKYLPSFRKIAKENFIYKFWFLFIFSIFLGTIVSLLLNNEKIIFNEFITYFYLAFVSIGIYFGMQKKDLNTVMKIFKYTCYFSSIWYIYLYFRSKYISNIFYLAPLWYGNGVRFSGGGDNPHQLSTLMCVVIIGNLYYLVSNYENNKNKILAFISLICSLYVGLQTKSSTLLVSLFFSVLLFIYVYVSKRLHKTKDKIILGVSIVFFLIIFIIIFYDNIYTKVVSFIESDENGMGRIELFKTAIIPFKKSPIFGLGPGLHGYNGVIELHNMYLEILAMAGLLGLSIFIHFSYSLCKNIYKTPLLICPIIALYAYGIAGFTFRRLVFWITIPIILNLSRKIQETNS